MSISKSDRKLIEEVKALGEENRALRVENEFLRRQVKDFEEKLNTNSRNSSKSPSQDPYRKRKGQKKPSGKKQGAQKGHQGNARQTVSPVDVTFAFIMIANSWVTFDTDNGSPDLGAVFIFSLINRCHLKPLCLAFLV